MTRLLLAGALAVAFAAAPLAQAGDKDKPAPIGESITLTGCVIVGTDPDTFVLTHASKVVPGKAHGSDVVLGAHGLQSAEPEVIYWLNHESAKQFRGLTGHRVEVSGTITHVSTGKVKVEKELDHDGRDNTVEIEARGKKAHAKTDRPVDNAGPSTGEEIETRKTLPVHRIKVASVRDLSAQCP